MAVVGAFAVPGTAPAASGLEVQPGLWEFRSSLPDPTGSVAQPVVHRTCVRDRVLTPARVMAQVPECRLTDAVVETRAAKWKMRCDTPIGPMAGRGSLRTNGVEVAGTLELTMDVGGFAIPATSPFRGRRLGPCR